MNSFCTPNNQLGRFTIEGRAGEVAESKYRFDRLCRTLTLAWVVTLIWRVVRLVS
jgi:hypothetical protein